MNDRTKPRVLILSHMYPSVADDIGGIFIHQHVKALYELGVDLMVISPVPWSPGILSFKASWKYYGSLPKEETFQQIRVMRPRYIELPFDGFRALSGWSMCKCLLPIMKKLRKTFEFNIIHAHTITPDGRAATLLGKYFNVPVVCSVRGSDLNQYPHYSKRMYEVSRRVIEEADSMITVSSALARKAIAMGHIKDGPHVIYNGIDTTRFFMSGDRAELKKNSGIPVGCKVITFIGRCERDKGIYELFEVFAVLHDMLGLCLLIVGDGGDSSGIRQMAADRGLAGKVFLTGKVPHDDIPKYLNMSDVFVLPSYSEGMPNALLEAMACGLPIVATRVGGIPEVITHEREGLLCEPEDTISLRECIERILRNREEARIMGKRAAEKVKGEFTWEKNARKHLVVYKGLIIG
jgi:glycosyltransferase involved in cell wall biosynthesis